MSESIEALTGKSREVTEKVDRNEYDDAKREFAAASEALAIAKTAYWRAERRLRNAEMARAREYADCFGQPEAWRFARTTLEASERGSGK